MDYAIGIGLALVVSGWAALVRFDRDRVFYPTLLVVVIALYYVLFAVMSGSVHAILVESAVMTAFAAVAVHRHVIERVRKRSGGTGDGE